MLKLPGRMPVLFKNYTGKKIGRPFGTAMSQKQLNALRNHGVPAGECLNPYGKCGNTQRGRYRATYFKRTLKVSFREAAMKRKRIIMKRNKAIALEAHEIQRIARESATLAMQTLREISANKRAPESSRIAASAVILDRAYGKASQTSITANVTDGKTHNLTGDELNKRIDSTLKRVENLTSRAPKAAASKKRPADLRKYH
jgi:hypothetical protein